MRVIKFRGLVVEGLASGNKWITGGNEFHEVFLNHADKLAYIEGHAVEYDSITQYTGLKDKNGTDIYEGDIGWNSFMEQAGIVKYKYGEFVFDWGHIASNLFEDCNNIKIVGNIYEDKHLLEVES